MSWQFTNDTTLLHKKTGFMIVLGSGTWDKVENITPYTSENLSFLQQAQLLREGLEYAEMYTLEQIRYAKMRALRSEEQPYYDYSQQKMA